MNLETTRLRGRPRNRWQDEVREDGRLVGGKGWKERVYNREEWKKFLRTARNSRNGIIRVKEKRNVLREIKRREANWIGHILLSNCLLKHGFEGHI
jgi:hypothetical protein